MLEIAAELGQGTNMLGRDLTIKFVQHFVAITDAINRQGLWDEEDGFYYDRLVAPDGRRSPVPVRSMVGIVPLLGAVTVHEPQLVDVALFEKTFGRMLERRSIDPSILQDAGFVLGERGDRRFLFGIVPPPRLDARLRESCSTRRSSSRRTACARSPPRTVNIRSRSTSTGITVDRRLPAGGVHHRDVRRQLQLARTRVVPAQPPRGLRAASATAAISATTSPSSTRPARATACRCATSPTTCGGA